MDTIFHQLSGLVLGSVPTMILFLALVFLYGVLVRRPLEKVLGERRARTVGAVEQARGAIAAAEAKATDYEGRLRTAKVEIFQAREARLKRWNEDRERALNEARLGTGQRVASARQEIETSMSSAKVQIEATSGELSARILQSVLPAGAQEAAQ